MQRERIDTRTIDALRRGNRPAPARRQRPRRADGRRTRDVFAPAAAIEDYGLIGDCPTAALVGRDGSIDWLCWPRFDSAACFAALLGASDTAAGDRARPPHGPGEPLRGDTLILETLFETTAALAVIDFMPSRRVPRSSASSRGARRVAMRMKLTLRFDYGSSVPWVTHLRRRHRRHRRAEPGRPAQPVAMRGEELVDRRGVHRARRASACRSSQLWRVPSAAARPIDATTRWRETEASGASGPGAATVKGEWRDAVHALAAHAEGADLRPTGGIVAAPTTSLPEQLGGARNWDYRFCWLRDATFTLYALMGAGYYEEARAWRDWLLRAVAGEPDDLQIMYGIAGERGSPNGSALAAGLRGPGPVRVGNAAHQQLQLDVYGEMMDALHLAREGGLDASADAWGLQCAALMTISTRSGSEPDEGIWEVRGGRRHFTHSKVMAWVAFECGIRDAEKYGFDGAARALARARATRSIAPSANTASTPSASFFHPELRQRRARREPAAHSARRLPARRRSARDRHHRRDRARTASSTASCCATGPSRRQDGLPPAKASSWPAVSGSPTSICMQGRSDEADALFERLLGCATTSACSARNTTPSTTRLVGNFPQAFSHLSLVHAVLNFQNGFSGFASQTERLIAPTKKNRAAVGCAVSFLLRRSVLEPTTADAARDQRNQEQHDEDEEQQLRDTCSGAGNSTEPQCGRDQSHDEKNQRVVQHDITP